MTPRKHRLLVATFSYGGNGGTKSSCLDTSMWLLNTVPKIKEDPRIESVIVEDFADTPITMCRNRSVVRARELGCDLLLMLDSDMAPDLYLGRDPSARPFWGDAFDFLYKQWDRGPVVVGAPYCGPPPNECVYVFCFRNKRNSGKNPDHQLEMYTREEARIMGGIQECAALPTGLILYDMRIFDLLEPNGPDSQGWFAYEWTDKYAQQKASTEDVMATRNMSFVGCEKLGYNPVHCSWDSWAGHWKPYCVEKPTPCQPSDVSRAYAEALKRIPSDMKLINVRSSVSAEYIAQHLVQDEPAPTRSAIIDGVRNQTPLRDLEVLQGLVRRLVERHPDRPLTIVEIGSFIGESALAMCDALGPQGGTIYCVDTWKGTPSDKSGQTAEYLSGVLGDDALYKAFLHETGHKENIVPIRGESVEVAKRPPPEIAGCGADLIFIDADHLYEAVKADLKAWRPHLAEHGIICGHDYGLFEGVRQAVHETFINYDVENLVWSYDFGRSTTNGRVEHQELIAR